MEELISVIIPIYNVESYLTKCIESVIGQDYRNLEIILIDDGSTDNSAQICIEYAKKDPRIIYRRKDNGGPASARNEGLRIASGSWIGYVDADDYISQDMYSTLANEADHTTKSIICCGVRIEDLQGKEIRHLRSSYKPDKPFDLSREEALLQYLNPTDRLLYSAPWDKIFRADIAKRFSFDEAKFFAEDFDYTLNCLMVSDGLRYIPYKKYHYLIRLGSLTSSREISKKSFDRIYFANKALDLVESNGLSREIIDLAKVYRCIAAARLTRRIYKERADISLYKDECRQCRQILDSCGIGLLRRIKGREKLLVLLAKYAPWILKV